MAREVANMSLETDVKEALDEFAKMLGISRSSAANMILKAALDVDRSELVAAMTEKLLAKEQTAAAAAVEAAING